MKSYEIFESYQILFLESYQFLVLESYQVFESYQFLEYYYLSTILHL